MKVALGSDHAGFLLKEKIKSYLKANGFEYEDFGCHSEEPVDYPDVAKKVAENIKNKRFNRGILFCGTGIGMAITANKVSGVRAALCHDPLSAKLSRLHNDSNVLTMGGRIIGDVLANEIIRVWLETPFEGGRHEKRLEKIKEIENLCKERDESCA